MAIRFFSPQANYVTSDFVVNAGNLYVATAPITAGAFNPANWNRIVLSTDSALFLPLAGGTLSNTLYVNIPTGGSPALYISSPLNTNMYILSQRSGEGARRDVILGSFQFQRMYRI